MPERYLVTGGAGFIGSHLVERLVRDGHQVRAIDNFSTGKRENIEPFLNKIDFIEGTICDLDLIRDAMRDIDYVLHQGALGSVPRSVKDPITTNLANVDGTLNVLVAAKDVGIKRVVYASSSSVYGDTPTLPKHEEMRPEPRSPYAVSKLTGEIYCRVFYEVYGLETVALRYFNVFGPRQDPESQHAAVIPKFVMALLKGESPTIDGDGEQSRDFTYIDNVVEANLLAAKAEGAAGKFCNIACNHRVTVNELFNDLKEILGTSLQPHYASPRPGDVRHSLADISRAKEILGYEPKIDVHRGLERTVAWYKSQLG